MEEIWKDVVGYEGRYKVSNLGNVKSVIFSARGKENLLSLLKGKDYLLVRLYKDGKGSMQRVHRLVAEAFIENPNGYPVVNHKNWDKHDNRAENLEWCTYSYNNWYLPIKSGSYKTPVKKPKERPWKDFAKPKRTVCVETGEAFDSISLAAKFAHVEQSNISRALTGRQRTSGGYHWKYADEESKSVGTLSFAEGNITDWIPARKIQGDMFVTDLFDLSDLRKLRGRIRFVIQDCDGEKRISICSSDYFADVE